MREKENINVSRGRKKKIKIKKNAQDAKIHKSKRNKGKEQKVNGSCKKDEMRCDNFNVDKRKGLMDGIEAQERNGVNLRSLRNEWRKKNNVIKAE